MKKFLMILFVFMTVFIMPTFASPTGGGDSLVEYSIPSAVDADIAISESLIESVSIHMIIIPVENVVMIRRSTIRMLSMLSAAETNIKLKAVEELMLRKTTVGVLSGNLIRYVRLAA